MQLKKTYFFLPLLALLVLADFASAQSKKIIVVPYTRFQFISDFDIKELAEINEIEPTVVYKKYVEEMNSVFSSFSTKEVSFIPIQPKQYKAIKKYVRYKLDKFKGRKYNASDLSLFPEDTYNTLLDNHEATHIMFINWYNIRKSVHTVYIGDRNKRAKFSTHYLDYDVYDATKVRIFGKTGAKLHCGDFPSQSIISNKSLKVVELKECYNHFFIELLEGLN